MKDKNLTNIVQDLVIQGATSGVVSKVLEQAIAGAQDHELLLGLVIPLIGVTAVVQQSIGLRKRNHLVEQEIEKLNRTLEAILSKMEKHNIRQLDYLYDTKLNPNRYQFVKNIIQEAMEAKNETVREYCASMVIFAGVVDFEEEGIDYRKLYKCLKVLSELDELDFRVLHLYELQANIRTQHSEEGSRHFKKNSQELLDDENVQTQEIKLSINKLSTLGLFNRATELYSYEDQTTKGRMIEQISRSNPEGETPTYSNFKRYVHTFL